MDRPTMDRPTMDRPAQVELVSPVPSGAGARHGAAGEALAALAAIVAAPSNGFAGRRIGLVDNSKTNARELLTDIQQLLCERVGAIRGPLERKEVSGPLAEDALGRLRAGADVVLVASAD
jgi:hypothetical protein